MPNYTENTLRAAIDAVNSGTSIRRAAKDYGIPLTTLHNRLAGREPRKTAYTFRQKLSPVQEAQLTEWVLVQGALGLPPTHAQIRTFASRILATGGSTEGVGKHWLEAFLRRNPTIKTLRARRMDFKRVDGTSTEKIQAFFNLFNLPAIRRILPEDRWNMDETGIMEGLGINGLVVGSAAKRVAIRKDGGRRNWTSIIECISATGRALDPLVIFKGGDV